MKPFLLFGIIPLLNLVGVNLAEMDERIPPGPSPEARPALTETSEDKATAWVVPMSFVPMPFVSPGSWTLGVAAKRMLPVEGQKRAE